MKLIVDVSDNPDSEGNHVQLSSQQPVVDSTQYDYLMTKPPRMLNRMWDLDVLEDLQKTEILRSEYELSVLEPI